MELLTGTFIYVDKYYQHIFSNFQTFAIGAFGTNNVVSNSVDTLHIIFQNQAYKFIFTNNNFYQYTEITIYTTKNEENYISLFPANGILEIIQHHLIAMYRIQFFECIMFEAKDFLQIKATITQRKITNTSVYKLYKKDFEYDINIPFKNYPFNHDIKSIILSNTFIKTEQPTTTTIIECDDINCSTHEHFFLRIGIEIGWNSLQLLEAQFVPMDIADVISDLRIEEMKAYLINIPDIMNCTKVFNEDTLSFIIQTKNKFIYLEELFWWS